MTITLTSSTAATGLCPCSPLKVPAPSGGSYLQRQIQEILTIATVLYARVSHTVKVSLNGF